MERAMDFAKVADIVCPILSCSACEVDKVNLDPYTHANAFDEFGYRMLSCLRAQGLPASMCLLQHE
jgi:pyruvate dehydrogenase E1 component beta subunit/pre-rRNA-processing protein TSR1